MNTYIGQITSPALKERSYQKDAENGSSTGIYGNIDASAVKDTNLIQVKVTSGDPYVATKNDQYIDRRVCAVHDRTQSGSDEPFGELPGKPEEKTDKELQEAIKALQEYEKKPRGVAVLELEFNSSPRICCHSIPV